jgi:hypothetical protein
MNLCRACNRDFTCATAFDRHRTGSFRKGTRRCMTDSEMLLHKLELKASGRWGWRIDEWKRAQITEYQQKRRQQAILIRH